MTSEFRPDSPDFDAVLYLLNNSIAALSLEQKVELKKLHKQPEVSLLQQDGKYLRKFQNSWYNKYQWLCGTGKGQEQKLLCFYCLMFGGNGEDSWRKTGVNTIKNFEKKAKKHAASENHIKCAEKFHMLGRCRIDHSVSEGQRLQAIKHNEMVSKNRHIIGRLVDVVCYLGIQELAFRGHRESQYSFNKGNYLATLDLLASEESFMKEHIESDNVFKGTSSDIQNDLIKAVTTAVQERIRREIESVEFVSIQADETTDVSVKSQLSIIVRYCINGTVEERFLGFYDVSSDKSARGLADVIITVLKDWNIDKTKLVCQTYDGAAVMSGHKGGVQTIVRESYPFAIFVHCYAHQLNLVLLHAAKTIKEVKLFICNLTVFHSFFSRSSRRADLLREQGFQLPHPSPTRWNYHSRAVVTIKKYYSELKSAVQHIINSDNWDPESIQAAIGIDNILNNHKFLFMLCLFSRIFVYTDFLFNVLQCKTNSDVNLCIKEVKVATANIRSLRCDKLFNEIEEESATLCSAVVNVSQAQRRVAYEILDSILVQLETRFGNFGELSFVELLDESKFKNYHTKFPQDQLNKLVALYPTFFEVDQLKSELVNIYSDPEKYIQPQKLLAYIVSNELQCVYIETTKLLNLVMTIPLTSVSSERAMSALKRIKTYLRNSMNNSRLSNLGTLAIEKELLWHLSRTPDFKTSVIDIFAGMRERRIELIYKQIV